MLVKASDLTESEQEGTADKCFDPGYILTRKMAFFSTFIMYPGHNKDLCNCEVKVKEQKCLITELTVLKIASTPSPSLRNTASRIYILQLVFK